MTNNEITCPCEGCTFKGLPQEFLSHALKAHKKYKAWKCRNCMKKFILLSDYLCHDNNNKRCVKVYQSEVTDTETSESKDTSSKANVLCRNLKHETNRVRKSFGLKTSTTRCKENSPLTAKSSYNFRKRKSEGNIIKEPLSKVGKLKSEDRNLSLQDLKELNVYEQQFNCSVNECTYSTDNKLCFENHQKVIHCRRSLYQCFYCTFESDTKREILYHMRSLHENQEAKFLYKGEKTNAGKIDVKLKQEAQVTEQMIGLNDSTDNEFIHIDDSLSVSEDFVSLQECDDERNSSASKIDRVASSIQVQNLKPLDEKSDCYLKKGQDEEVAQHRLTKETDFHISTDDIKSEDGDNSYIFGKLNCNISKCSSNLDSITTFLEHLKSSHPNESEFLCPIQNCHATLLTLDRLFTHMIQHDPNLLGCLIKGCFFATFSEACMEKHLQKIHSLISGDDEDNASQLSRCHKCELITFSEDSLNSHLNVSHKSCFRKVCPSCNILLSDLSDILDHVSVCQSKLSLKEYLGNLIDRWQSGCLYKRVIPLSSICIQCPFCRLVTQGILVMREHLYKEFDYKKETRCLDFEKYVQSFIRYEKRLSLSYILGEGLSFVCNVCLRRFPTVSEFRVHLYGYHEYSPYRCHCGQVFYNLMAANKHGRTVHGTGEIEYKYEFSEEIENWTDKMFESQTEEILQRIPLLTGVSRCIWTECSYVGLNDSDIQEHLKNVHVPVKHSCDYCSFQTFSTCALKRHTFQHTQYKHQFCSLKDFKKDYKGVYMRQKFEQDVFVRIYLDKLYSIRDFMPVISLKKIKLSELLFP